MRAIVLLGGEISLVNDEKYDELVIYSWHLHSNGYAVRCNGGHSTYMHRIVINAPDKVWVDHIDGDKLDNRIENLRLCNASQNGGNRGPIEDAKRIVRKDCLREGLCVTIEPTLFIYKGGEELGYVIGLINYPRFPSTNESIWNRAVDLAMKLLDETYQESILIMAPDKTQWFTKREQ